MEGFVHDVLDNEQWWWEIGRRALVKSLLKRYDRGGPRHQILEIGCGGGALIQDLRPYGSAAGIDVGEPAVRNCYNRGLNTVALGDAMALPFQDELFDVVIAVDVLEHVKDDMRVLDEIYRVSKPSATIILTVPAFNFLWSRRDIQCHHYRRYRLEEVRTKVLGRGFRILKSTYINMPLFIPLLMMVKTGQLSSKGKPSIQMDYVLVPPPVNKILSQIVKYEARLLKHTNLPIGSSIACVARREGDGITISPNGSRALAPALQESNR
jgi:SAM-dependent methyltransferase